MNHKHFSTKRVRQIAGSLLLLMALVPQSIQTVYAQSVTAAQASADIPCDQTPFGRLLDFGQENEVFMGFRNVDAPSPGSLGSDWFDQDKTTGQLREQQLTLDTNNARNNIATLAGTTADRDGDGKAEFVQAFTDANGLVFGCSRSEKQQVGAGGGRQSGQRQVRRHCTHLCARRRSGHPDRLSRITNPAILPMTASPRPKGSRNALPLALAWSMMIYR